MGRYLVLILAAALSGGAAAGGVDCAALPAWSQPIGGYQVNLHHVFCGEPGRNGKAKGFHAMPNGQAPSSYVSSTPADPANGAGVYTLKSIRLRFGGETYVKSFSSMFPSHCSLDQINQSIVYSMTHNSGPCAGTTWALCGPNAPKGGGVQYCVANGGAGFEIATAVLPQDRTRINTGFPIYAR